MRYKEGRSSAIIDKQGFLVPHILEKVAGLVSKGWRLTFLQINVGTLVPFLLNGHRPEQRLTIDAKVIYSRLVFENTELYNV